MLGRLQHLWAVLRPALEREGLVISACMAGTAGGTADDAVSGMAEEAEGGMVGGPGAGIEGPYYAGSISVKLTLKETIKQSLKAGLTYIQTALSKLSPRAWWNNFKSASVLGKALMLSKMGLYSMRIWAPIAMKLNLALTPYLTIAMALTPYIM